MRTAHVKPHGGGRSQNNQQADGGVRIHEVLRPYMGVLATITAA